MKFRSKQVKDKIIMKKYLFLLSVALLGLSSCSSDYLETAPESSTSTSTIVESAANAKLSINGISRLMSRQYLHSQGYNGEGTIKTYFGNYPGNDFQKVNYPGWAPIMNQTYHLQKSSAYCYYPWYYYYTISSNANGIICNIDNATGSEEDKAFVKAQALVYRAYAFFMLSQLYAHRWSDEQGNTPGIVLRIDQSTGDHPRATLAQTYAQIYADLDEAISLFQKSGQDRGEDEFYLPSLDVAYALYSRAALTRQDWQNAAKYAALAKANHPIMSNDQYFDGMNTPNKEWIWGVYEAEDQTIYYYSFYAYQGSNASSSQMRTYPTAISKELIDQIPETDVRRGLYLIPTDEELEKDQADKKLTAAGRSTGVIQTRAKKEFANYLYSTSLIYIYMQYKHRCSFYPGGGSFNIFRGAEMYYNEAEALCMQGQDAQAQEILFQAVSPRDPAYVKSTKTGNDLLTEIKLYRRFDLWGEGFDWFDYKRWGDPISRKALGDGGSFHTSFAVTVEPSAGNKWTWELPLRETDYNKGLDMPE